MASEASSLPPRRDLPKPVEMTTSTRTQRRFAVELMESPSRRNRTGLGKEGHTDTVSTGARRLLSQPIETAIKSNRNASSGKQPSPRLTSHQPTVTRPIGIDSSTSKPRRFAPQLIESSRRRRRSTDNCPAVLPSDKTEVSPGDQVHVSHPRLVRVCPDAFPIGSEDPPVIGAEEVTGVAESRFSSSRLRKKEPRQHSFRVPDLASIESMGDSEGSNESNCPSLSTSPSATSAEMALLQNARRERNCSGETSGDYVLRLAAETAEKQLREQAMAAYPNENIYEHVDHFAVDREERDDNDLEESSIDTPKASWGVSRTPRNDSNAGWDAAELRRHHETLEQQRNKHKTTLESELDRRRSLKGPFRGPAPFAKDSQKPLCAFKKDPEMESMRSAASPPMAGEDLRFALCSSPKETRLDVGHYPYTLKDGAVATPHKHTGLWTPGCGTSEGGSVNGGLWMGTCAKPIQAALEHPTNLQTGLLTPAMENDDPFDLSDPYIQSQLPPSPPSSQSDSQTFHLDSVHLRKEQLALEFDDAFVTQVYNYLSLGYPCLAQKFDAEISKISRIPIVELRQDDSNTNAKGYVCAPEGVGRNTQIRDLQEGNCVRWSALRKYVREWARQQSHLTAREDGQNGEWGQRARRGSWAL